MIRYILFFSIAVSFLFAGTKLFSQDNMTPPKPLDNKVYDGMTGDWTANSDMMGMKMKEEVNIKWALNHQYIIMSLTAVSVDNPNIKYSGMGVFGADAKGNVKGWWFDDWGASAMSTGSGTFGDNKFEITDGNEMFKETRSFEVSADQIIMKAKGTYNMNGKDVPFDESTIYSRKK